MTGHETAYLIDTVGHALAKGVSATVAAQPDDPVEHLAEWLLSYVKSEELHIAYIKEKKQHIEEEKRRLAQELDEQARKDAAEQARRMAIEGLAAMDSQPHELWATAVHLVKQFTSAAGVYVANIIDEEQPDWQPPEDPEADVESQDEADHSGGAEPGAQDMQRGGPAAAADAEEQQAVASDGGAEGARSAIPPLPNYSKKLLQYVAASKGHEFMTKLQLKRPPAADDDSGAPAEQAPITFKILDEHVPLLEVPTVSTEPRVKFLRNFPRIGGYCAAAVPSGPLGPAGGSYHAVLAADTLLPEGHGQPLTALEVSLVWDVAQALGKALDAAGVALQKDAARGGAVEALAELQAAVEAARKDAPPQAAAVEVVEDPAAAVEDGTAAEAVPPAELITQLEAHLQHCEQRLAAGKVAAANAEASLKVEKEVLAAVVKAITSVRGVALHALKLCTSSPPATFHVLRAVLLLLGREPDSVASWREVSVSQLHVGVFEELAAYDATQERDAALWKRVRSAYKAVQTTEDFVKELPQCGLGAMLLQWLKQVWAVARKAATLREAKKALAEAQETKAKQEQQLMAAKEAKVKMDDEAEAAAKAAEGTGNAPESGETEGEQVCHAAHTGLQQQSSSGDGSNNPLELLRVTYDPQQRAKLMQQLDTRMSEFSELYQPCPVEEHLSKELGVWSYNVMLFAVQNPALQNYQLETQVKPAISSLKAAGVDVTDIWFLVTKRLDIFAEPISLQRWLDFLMAQDLHSRDMATFLLRAPEPVFTSCTQGQALQVLTYLKNLGVKQEFLFSRVVCICPGILLKDVQTQLQPIVSYLMSLGLETQHVARISCVYPELLLSSVQDQLQPLVAYLQGLGCSTCQAARLLQEVPQALRNNPSDVFGARVAALRQLGIVDADLQSVVSRSTVFLTTKDAPHEQIAFLKDELGYSLEQVKQLVLACPAILSEKPLELQRKVDFLRHELNMELPDLLLHPGYLGASLMQVTGPRHAFAVSKGFEAKLTSSGGSCSTTNVRKHGGAWGWNLTLLVSGEDVDFVEGLGASVNEYDGFRTAFEEEYTAKLSQAAAKEFQEELKKLGIYEGS
eukprot:gene1846-2179_t